jgi:poly(3-hydroxybutyrate) depolymerase
MVAAMALAGLLAAAAPVEVSIPSSRDGAEQHAMLMLPESAAAPVPLLVHLHSWSADYKSSGEMEVAVREVQQRGWAFVSPDFRGPNNRPEACGSDLAVSDIVDSVRYAQSNTKIDGRRIYLLGGSGGGHMSLLMAARHPELWAAVSAWVPISDLAAWHASTKAAGLRYREMLEQCCGGPPGSPAADAEYRKRSPLPILARARRLPLSINVGIHDGHKGSVPVSHSLLAFNEVAKANGQPKKVFRPADIDYIKSEQCLPAGIADDTAPADPGRKHQVLLYRTAGRASITIFEGGHETDFATAIRWLETHKRGR